MFQKVISFFIITVFLSATSSPAQDSVIVKSNNRFAFDLFAKLGKEEGNMVISPFSISSALAMTYAGARTVTETEMQKVLHFGNQEVFHSGYKPVLEKIRNLNLQEGIEINAANAVWAEKNYRFRSEYFDLLKENYNSGLRFVSFGKKTEKSRKTINAWVEKETNKHIAELLEPGTVDKSTTLVLTNAVYFNAVWAKRFDPEKTKKDKFFVTEKETIEVDFMNRSDNYFYYENKVMQSLEIPYPGNKVSMIVIVPKTNASAERVATLLNNDLYEEIITGAKENKIDVHLPKFEIISEFSLEATLAEMGMPSAFNSEADFSGMTGNKGLFIDKVIHKAFLHVSEEGTEAAAATAVVMRKNAIIPKKFEVNRPFVYLIKDNTTGSILFIGKVNRPV
ncbi:MAG: serpin family protein [Bacteroidetes bacterium]|nr:serpin family protein [Bacteroidota bacterium]